MDGMDHTWLEAAWDVESIEANLRGWEIELGRCREMAYQNRYEMRVQEVEVPGVYEMFEMPFASARDKEGETSE